LVIKKIDAMRSLLFCLNSAIYLVAVIPRPAVPRATNMLIVERTIPNSPYSSLPNMRAHIIPDISTINLANAVPVNDQKAPDAIRLPMSDVIILFFNEDSSIKSFISY
jgi:hypothetical protein